MAIMFRSPGSLLMPTLLGAEFIKRALMAEGEQGQQQLKLLLDEKERPKRDEKLPPEKVG